MSKKIYLPLLVLLAVVGLSSCSSKLQPLATDYIKVVPQPLEEVAGKVPVTINATFPQKWFNKKATVVVVPVLRYEGGEAWGTSYTFQGEKVAGNGQVIPEKTGANVTMTSSFNYVPAMQKSELYLTFTAKIGNKEVTLPELKIADGVLSTASLANAGFETPAIAPDKFQRIIKEAYDANIMFLVRRVELRSSELKKSDLVDWKGIVQSADQTPNQKVSIEVSAYASPEGGFELNEKLASGREKNTNEYLSKEMKKANVDVPITARYTAQDWEGFKELVEKSNLQDKNLVLSVLSMYSDPEQREREIRNMSSVFSTLAEEVLPQLRRSRLTANVEIIGKSDEEISNLAASNPKALTVEELLYAATLVKAADQKAAIYQKASELYSNDFRPFNNLGVIEYAKGQLGNAEQLFGKAAQLSASAPEVNCNLGLVALAKGDKDKAQQYFGKASGVAELNNALGVLAIKNGQYAQAATAFGSTASNNAAIAQLMNKDYSKAQATLAAVATPNATTAYLQAVVAARTNNLNGVVTSLKQAVSADASFAKKAINDLEFAKYITNSDFLNVVK